MKTCASYSKGFLLNKWRKKNQLAQVYLDVENDFKI